MVIPQFISEISILTLPRFHRFNNCFELECFLKIPNFDKIPTLGAQSWSPMAARNIVREVYSALSSSEESGSKYDYDNDDSALVLIATLLILLSLLTLVTQISLVTLVVQWHICLHILLKLLYYYNCI